MRMEAPPGARWFIALSIMLAMSVWMGCGEEPRSPGGGNVDQVERLWRVHERAIERAVEGAIKDDEFEQACDFFATLTGIEVHGRGSYVGWVPTDETGEDLARLRKWYEQHRAELRWDPTEGTIRRMSLE